MHPVCISHPKSGRTWLRVMLDALDVAVNYTHLDTNPNRETWGRHFKHLDVPRAEGKIIFLHRDPRDTAVSYYHHMMKREQISFRRQALYWMTGRIPSKNMFDFVRSPRFGIEKIIVFNLACAEHLDAFPLSYEYLHADTVGCLVGIAKFLEYNLAFEKIESVAKDNTFEKMRKREATGAYNVRILQPRDANDPNSFKVRRGKIGSWRDEMDDETQEFANQILKRYGYFERLAQLLGSQSGDPLGAKSSSGAGSRARNYTS